VFGIKHIYMYLITGAFLVPYLSFLILGGAPVLMLEVGLGQYMSEAGFSAWNICPLFQGK